MAALVLCLSGCTMIIVIALIVFLLVSHGSDDDNKAHGSDLPRVSTDSDVIVSANGIRINLAKRLSGGVWTMSWNGHEFVSPEMGNGGSQQSAIALDIPVGHSSEMDNPTEGGRGYHGGVSTSEWLEARSDGREAFSKQRMGYYVKPGETVESVHQGRVIKSKARGTGLTSNVVLSKRVSIGYKGFPHVVNNMITFDMPSVHWFMQMEILCGHMPRAFDKIYTFDGSKAVKVDGKVYRPEAGIKLKHIIMAKDESCALGVMCHTWPSNGTFQYPWYLVDAQTPAGHLPWDKGQYPAGTVAPLSKWNVVWHAGRQDVQNDKRHTGKYTFGVALILGTLDTVVDTLRQLA